MYVHLDSGKIAAAFFRLSGADPNQKEKYAEIINNSKNQVESMVVLSDAVPLDENKERCEHAAAAIAVYEYFLMKSCTQQKVLSQNGKSAVQNNCSDEVTSARLFKEQAIEQIADLCKPAEKEKPFVFESM